MTKVLNNVKNSIMEGVKENRMIKRISNSKFAKRFMATFIALGGYSQLAFAEPNENGKGMIVNIINEASTWVIYLGAIFIFYGVIAFVMALKSHNAESQQNAAMTFLVGCMPCSIKLIMNAVGVI